jgi:hypothetical protein
MDMKKLIFGGALAATLVAATAHAEPADEVKAAEMKRASFSGGRFVVELLVGGAIGSLAAYGTYVGICGDEPCLGGALTGWVANFAVTPAAVWGVGTVMGGRGRLAHAYYGAVPALAPFSAPNAPIGLQFALSVVFLPITSSLMYELSSHIASQQWVREHAPAVAVRPLAGGGGIATLGLQF